MSAILWPDTALGPAEAGGKAASLSALIGHGFDVPPFFVLGEAAFDGTTLTAALDDALTRLGPGPYAVRSSGVDEDGSQHSHAGHAH